MTTMRERHLQLAMDSRGAGDVDRAKLHERAAEMHRVAHLGDKHAERAAAATSMAFDAGEWDEGKHKRGEGGKFGSGGGGKSSSAGKSYEDHMKDASAAAAAHKAAGGGSKAPKGGEGLNDTDREHNKTATEGKITHRAGEHRVHYSPLREKRGMAGHGVFKDGEPKALSSHKTHDEAKVAANKAHAEGQAAEGGEKQKVGREALREKLRGKTKEQLHSSLKHPGVDPDIKKEIERELDDRANRGA